MPVRQNPEGPTVPNVGDVKVSDHFDDLWKRIGIQQLIPSSGFSQMPYDLYCKAKEEHGMQTMWHLLSQYCGTQGNKMVVV